MKCPCCTKEIHYEPEPQATFDYGVDEIDNYKANPWSISHGFCPSCRSLIVIREDYYNDCYANKVILKSEIIYPNSCARPLPSSIPDKYKKDFSEAVAVLPLSMKASAAISRRTLQIILREQYKIKRPNLSQEIDDFLKLQGIPSHLADGIDAVRVVGNFAAHPTKEVSTGMIVDVEAGEAEWLLDVLEDLFDFAFVQPQRLLTRRQQLNEKLAKVGKGPLKQAVS